MVGIVPRFVGLAVSIMVAEPVRSKVSQLAHHDVGCGCIAAICLLAINVRLDFRPPIEHPRLGPLEFLRLARSSMPLTVYEASVMMVRSYVPSHTMSTMRTAHISALGTIRRPGTLDAIRASSWIQSPSYVGARRIRVPQPAPTARNLGWLLFFLQSRRPRIGR